MNNKRKKRLQMQWWKMRSKQTHCWISSSPAFLLHDWQWNSWAVEPSAATAAKGCSVLLHVLRAISVNGFPLYKIFPPSWDSTMCVVLNSRKKNQPFSLDEKIKILVNSLSCTFFSKWLSISLLLLTQIWLSVSNILNKKKLSMISNQHLWYAYLLRLFRWS